MKRLGLLLIMALSLACSKDRDLNNKPSEVNNQLVIKRGDICGWCAKNDTLVVTVNQARMRIYESCDVLSRDTSTQLTGNQWNQIHQQLDLQKFRSLNLNSCAVCYDGCDSWISIENDSLSHQIRWVKGDTAAIQKVRGFVKELDKLYKSFGG